MSVPGNCKLLIMKPKVGMKARQGAPYHFRLFGADLVWSHNNTLFNALSYGQAQNIIDGNGLVVELNPGAPLPQGTRWKC